MKIYNKELKQIENEDLQKRIQVIAEKEIAFLVQKYGIDEKLLREKLEKLAVVEREGKTHFVEYNGEKQEINSNAPASFVTKKNQEYDGNKWNFENAVYTNDNNSDHVIEHELFHYFSSNLEMNFNQEGIGYDKVGTLIKGYDRNDKVVDSSMAAEGLNEGITEFLAIQMDGNQSPSVYNYQVYLASILANSQDNFLINAYFDSDPKKFREFLEDFDKRQCTVSSEKLISLSKNGSDIVDTELLKGCLEYSLSFCKNIEQLKKERKRLLSIFKSMRNDINIEFDDENFDVKSFFDNVLSEKRKSIECKNTQELYKETLDVPKDILEIDNMDRKLSKKSKKFKNYNSIRINCNNKNIISKILQ